MLLALCVSLAAGAAAAAPATYTNPVLGGDVPDPGVVWAPELSLWVASTTGCDASGACFALHTSPDLAAWTPAGALFPTLATFPAWASRSDLTAWAPEIHRLASGEYLAVFVSKDAGGALVVGAARSAGGALGPYAATAAPLVTAPAGACYGVIDPTVVVASDAAAPPTLVFKTDGNSCGQRTEIVAVQLTPDGLNVSAGAPWRSLLTNDAPWEGPLVEAPWLIRNASSGYFYLFYSGSVYDQASYAIGVARGRTLDAPFEKAAHLNPVLRSAPGAAGRGLHYGPGHCAVVGLPPGAAAPQRWAMVYAAEQPPAGPHRNLMLDALEWDADGWPVVRGGYPSSDAEPIPRR